MGDENRSLWDQIYILGDFGLNIVSILSQYCLKAILVQILDQLLTAQYLMMQISTKYCYYVAFWFSIQYLESPCSSLGCYVFYTNITHKLQNDKMKPYIFCYRCVHTRRSNWLYCYIVERSDISTKYPLSVPIVSWGHSLIRNLFFIAFLRFLCAGSLLSRVGYVHWCSFTVSWNCEHWSTQPDWARASGGW